MVRLPAVAKGLAEEGMKDGTVREHWSTHFHHSDMGYHRCFRLASHVHLYLVLLLPCTVSFEMELAFTHVQDADPRLPQILQQQSLGDVEYA